MAQRGTNYSQYRAYANKEHGSLVLPVGCTESLPLTFSYTNDLTWHSRWYLEFTDNKYIRAVERFQKWPGLTGIAKKMAVAYHYGEIARRNPDDNLPAHLGIDPVAIRIDNSCAPIHLHLGAQNPHIAQANVDGLDLEGVDMFSFVKAVLKHRETNRTFESILGFKIR